MIFFYGSTAGDGNGSVAFVLLSIAWHVVDSVGVVGGRKRRRALNRQI